MVLVPSTNGRIFSTHPICSMNMMNMSLHGFRVLSKKLLKKKNIKIIKSQDCFKAKSAGKPSMVNSMGNPATCLLDQPIVITYVDKFR